MPLTQTGTKNFIETYNRHVDMVYRVCYSFMKNQTDAEDMVQETFLRLLSNQKKFADERHEKAWLIVTASNLCKDTLKKWWRTNENIDDYPDLPQKTNGSSAVMEAILSLSDDYKTVVYMYYYEGYSTAEIAQFLGCPDATVRSRLARARKQLQAMLGGAEE